MRNQKVSIVIALAAITIGCASIPQDTPPPDMLEGFPDGQSMGLRFTEYPLATPDDNDVFMFAIQPTIPGNRGLYLETLAGLKSSIGFDWTGTVTHANPSDTFTLNDSTSSPIFTVNSGGITLGSSKMLDTDEIRGITSPSVRIQMGGSSITFLAPSLYRLSAPAGGITWNYNNSGMSFGPKDILTSSESLGRTDYGTLNTAPLCNSGIAGSYYYDLNGDTDCRCNAAGVWVNIGVGPGPCA